MFIRQKRIVELVQASTPESCVLAFFLLRQVWGFRTAPAETLREDNQAAHTRESRQPVPQPPVDYVGFHTVRKGVWMTPLAYVLY